MKIINSTPVPVRLDLGQLDGTTIKYGMLVAKATFTLNGAGVPELETRAPVPIFDQDEDGELGLLPRDTLPRRDSAFEVIVVGAAYAPRPVSSSWIELRVGQHHRRLRVSGDREWLDRPGGPVISSPVPFERLELGWHRAFGGACKVLLDADTPFEFKDPINDRGRGFDAAKLATDYGKALRAPPGFPRLLGYRRWLPNLENPDHLISRPTDAPAPACWSTVPSTAGFLYLNTASQTAGKETLAEHLSRYYHRAHPDWVIPCPSEGCPIELFGMTRGQPLQFRMPRLRVLADYEIGARGGMRELEPQLLMLLPERRQLYLVYRHFFTLQTTPDAQRSFRIRIVDGWFVSARESASAQPPT